jgi:hypothetical protein
LGVRKCLEMPSLPKINLEYLPKQKKNTGNQRKKGVVFSVLLQNIQDEYSTYSEQEQREYSSPYRSMAKLRR